MASVRFTDVQSRPTEFLDVTSLTLDEFQQLVPPFEAAFHAPMAAWRFDGIPRTARQCTVDKHCPLPTPEDRLLCILAYVKTSALQVVQGRLFGMGQSKANQWIHVLLPALLAALRTLGDAPARSLTALAQRHRASGGRLTSLAPHRPAGGRGKGRLSERVEGIMTDTIAELYLHRQRYRPSDVAQEIQRRCHVLGLPLPRVKAVRTRIRAIAPEASVRRRHGRQAAHRLTPVHGTFPTVTHPLEVVQIDHTPVDCMIVDEYRRQPIGRPYLTLGIDVYSRCITGLCLTLEAPSSVSVGLCLAHSVLDKATELSRLEIEGEWPIWGKPGAIHVDNAAEFHSEALRRGCEQHGIRLAHRPVGQPHFGGTIERVLGTLMQRVHTPSVLT